MSSELAISVQQLGKCFHIYNNPRDRLLQMLAGQRRRFYREFWALRNVSFEIGKGETVGIVGRNGSGKSTLLQMVCGTLNQSEGGIVTNGRIAALLELGSGFNPEFSGRENVFLNAAVLGLSKAETVERFSEIEAFAEIGSFIDQPVKTYSSGMLVRLAFAVAINVEPEILIVDEALSVGDERFQRKCFARIEDIKRAGATILFVSHSGSTIVDLCDRALLMDSGELLVDSTPKTVIGQYQRLLYAPEARREELRENLRQGRLDNSVPAAEKDAGSDHQSYESSPCSGEQDHFDPSLQPTSTVEYASRGVRIQNAQIQTLDGRRVNHLQKGKRYQCHYEARFDTEASYVRFGMLVKTLTGTELGGAVTSVELEETSVIKAGAHVRVNIEFDCSLNPGVYFLNTGVVGQREGEETYLHRLLDALMFRVMPETSSLATGIIDFCCAPSIVLAD